MASEPDPNWPLQAWRGVVHEWASYGRAVVAVTIAPARTMQQWADGELELLSPLVCLLNAIAIVTIINVTVRSIRHTADDTPAWLELLLPAVRLFNTAVVASLLHLPLRLFGARRRWRTTLGAALFVNAGPLMPLYALFTALLAMMPARPTSAPRWTVALSVLFSVAYGFYLTATAAGAHRLRWWRALMATAIGAATLLGLSLLINLAQHR